jgi:glycosyltransferase involved in cell wall biosynthesis
MAARGSSTPQITIGLPVYNGEAHLRACIDSILAQTWGDFVLMVADNASTDGTAEIAREYASADGRVRYHPSPTNVGVIGNFNRCLSLAESPYFKWAAVDDLCAPTLVERCIAALSEDNELILCHSRTDVIDARGSVLYPYPHDGLRTDSPRPSVRFNELIRTYHWGVQQYGLIRTDALRAAGGLRMHPHADRVLLAVLALKGPFRELPETLFFYRRHEQASMLASRPHRYAWFVDPASRGRPVFPSWRLLSELARAVQRADLPAGEKARCYVHLARWPTRGLNSLRMARDVVVGAGIAARLVREER